MADICVPVVEFAAQTGRLDFVSLILASIGVILFFGGLFFFVNFRSIAKKQAEEEATKVAENIAERVANEYLQREPPRIIDQYREFTGSEPFTNDDADQIANAQDMQTEA